MRGKCSNCGDILCIMYFHTQVYPAGVSCKCGSTLLSSDGTGNAVPITDEEHMVEINKEFWWLDTVTINSSIELLKA